jgi:hypothetical protein
VGQFGKVYLDTNENNELLAAKVMNAQKFSDKEWKSSKIFQKRFFF